MKVCVDCKNKIQNVNAPNCPKCGGSYFTYGPPVERSEIEFSEENSYSNEKITKLKPTSESTSLNNVDLAKEFSKVINLQTQLIQSQNRTTHAVRAFVRFLFIQLAATTLAIAVWQLSNFNIDQYQCATSGERCSGNSFLQLVAAGIWVVGVIWSSRAGWSELEESEV